MIFSASRLRFVFVAAFLLIAGSIGNIGNVFAAEDYSQWSSSTTIFLNTTGFTPSLSGNVINFPVLVRLSTSNFSGFAQVKAGGADIRFSKSDGTTPLSYQIERWDAGNQVAEIWIRVDTIYSNSNSHTIKMLWGNPNAADSSKPANVFQTSNGFQAAWHLGETGNGNTFDATANNFIGTSSGTTKPVDAAGIIGKAKSFDGMASYFDVTGSAASILNFPQAGTYTISAWVNTNMVDGKFHDILTKGDHQYSLALNANNFWQMTEFKNNVGWVNSHATTAATVGTWKYVTGIKNGTAISLYMDGSKVADSNGGYNTAIPRVTTFDVAIGWNLDSAGFGGSTNGLHYFNGKIDELILTNTVRSADWINLCFQTQNAGQAVVSTCGLPVITTNPSNQTAASGQGGSFSIAASGATLYQWQSSVDGITWSNISGATATTLSFTAGSGIYVTGEKFRCRASNWCSTVTSTSATLCVSPSITVQPSNQTVPNGQTGSFSVTATGGGLSYQWQSSPDGTTWTNITGATGTTLSFTAGSGVYLTGAKFHCNAINSCGTVPSSSATLCVSASITTQPSNQTVPSGQAGSFTIAATNAVSYQWQSSPDGTTWTNIAGATGTTLSFTAGSGIYVAGARFRCNVTNSCATVTSNTAILSISCSLPAITQHPLSQTIPSGQASSFSVTATGGGLTYQWQYSYDGIAWPTLTGETGTTLSFTAGSGNYQNAVKIHCSVTNSCGTVASNAATLTVCTPPSTSDPLDKGVLVGQTASFIVNVGQGSPSFQWEHSTDGGSTWSDVTTGTGYDTANYTTAPTVQTDNGTRFRCKLYNTCDTITSGSALLTVCTPCAITANPSGLSVQNGTPVSFSVTATGSGSIGYQWQDSVLGRGWLPISSANSPTYGYTALQGDDGKFYRCVVTNTCATVYSTVAPLTVCTSPVIGTNPTDRSVTTGQSASFSVIMSAGSGTLNYQWQDSVAGGWFNISGNNAATYSFTTASGDNGKKFRCIVSNSCAPDAYSSAALLTVCTPPSIATPPASHTATAGLRDSFTVAASGTPSLQFQWQDSITGGTSWVDLTGETNQSYIITTVASGQNGWKYRCRVSSNSTCGTAVTTAAATLTVCTPPVIATQPVTLPLKQIGDVVSFSVTVNPDATGPAYQWERSPDGSTWTYAAGAGAATSTYGFTVAAGDTGSYFKCRITNSCTTDSIFSSIVSLSGCTPPSTSNPANQNVTANATATFSVTGSGTGTLLYQWQDSVSAWANVASGGTAASYSFTAVSNMRH
jgi:hypothetical protein